MIDNTFNINMHSSGIKRVQNKGKMSTAAVLNQVNRQKINSKPKNVITDVEAEKILDEVDRLLKSNQNLEGINLLRALKDNLQGVKNVNLSIIAITNLAILYYQVGFLQEAQEEFSVVIAMLKELSLKLLPNRNKDILRTKYETMLGKVQLQLCILYSELGKHDLALEHAKISCKINYNLIYDALIILYGTLSKLLLAKNYQKMPESEIKMDEARLLINNIVILTHLINVTKDLKLAFLQKQKSNILQQQIQLCKKYGRIGSRLQIDLLYQIDSKPEHLWIYKNKILDEIQLSPFQIDQFEDLASEMHKSQIIEKITFLAISLYCFSTETRFIQKLKNCDSHDVLDSEHWLSRSLQIAYMFMPSQAPILNQILIVHDRFHGLDKQTIPEDQQVTGFFKLLKPLSKPKNANSSKSPICSPIMIRIQAEKVQIDIQDPKSSPKYTQREFLIAKNNIQLYKSQKAFTLQSITRHNRIKGLSTGLKIIQFQEVQSVRSKASSRTIENPLSMTGNIKSTYTSRKFNKKREDKFRLNYSQLNGKALISEDLLNRPLSQEKQIDKNEQTRSISQRKKKSLPLKRKENVERRPSSIGATIKLQGLQLIGKKMEETLEYDFFEKLHSETRIIEATRMGGNVYINNNISLYISKHPESNVHVQTFVRGQVQKQDKDVSRRQIFLNKRRASNFVFPEDL